MHAGSIFALLIEIERYHWAGVVQAGLPLSLPACWEKSLFTKEFER
jgi:hypothetical protein